MGTSSLMHYRHTSADAFVLQWEAQHWEQNFNLDQGDIAVKWFKGGKTNIAYNCLDRHVKEGRGDQPCFLWEGNEPDQSCTLTYKQTMEAVGRLVSCRCSAGTPSAPLVAHCCYTHRSCSLGLNCCVALRHTETTDNRHSLMLACRYVVHMQPAL